MARRSKSKHRREQQNDPLEALRPLIFLGLLGMILYGAYSIIQKDPKEINQEWTSVPLLRGRMPSECLPKYDY